MDDAMSRRATSFGSVADAYERGRPGYPEDAVRWLVGDAPSRVVDLGAGTGKLTRQLVALGHDVSAVEPSGEMLEQLRTAVPGAAALPGSAEAIPLEDRSADAVVAGQAFHWFDAPSALAEIGRVLRPGGRLGLVWNMRDESVGWVDRLTRLLGSEDWRDGFPENEIAESGLYEPVEKETFRLEHALDRQTLLDLALSRSYVAVQPPGARAEILDAIGRLYDEVAGPDGIVLPYVTEAFRARRVP